MNKPEYTKVKPQYPERVWDGTSQARSDIRFDREPVYADHDQMVAEIQATQTQLNAVVTAAGVTSVDLIVPTEFDVSGNPITTSGTITISKSDQPANRLYCGPTSGLPAQPTFRQLVAEDLPVHSHSGDDVEVDGVPLAVMVGANGTDGVQGLVPQPVAGDGDNFLRGDGTWAVPPASSGTVSSVDLASPSEFAVSGNPITTSGTLTLTKSNQSAHTLWIGPTSGAATQPTFRLLVAGDLPSHSHNGSDITSGTVARARLEVMAGDGGAGGAQGAVPAPAAGDTAAGKYLRADGTWQTPPLNGGTVTSIAVAAPSSVLLVTGSPVTSSGTITLGLATQSQNLVFAGPTSGSAASPTFRALVALDLPTHTHSAVDITSGTLIASVLPVMIGDSGSGGTQGAVPAPAAGDAARFLKGDGTWSNLPPTGTVTSVSFTAPATFSVTGSPITSSGTIALGWSNQSAHTMLSGPTTGSAAAPTFRLLVASDLPTHSHDGGDITTGTVAAARLGTMTGDTGTGGASGAVPAPASGDAAAGKFLKADGTWTTPPDNGTVTSVALAVPPEFSVSGSPVTTTGTLTVSKATQNANQIYAGPTSGSPASPAFRSLVASDIPSHSHSGSDITSGTVPGTYLGQMVGDSGLGGAVGAVPAPSAGDAASGKYLRADGTWAVPPDNGTVTSIDLTMPGIFAVSGTPITTSGTIGVTLGTQTANRIFAGPTSGGVATPTFRALVALDLPSHNHSGADITSGTVGASFLGVMTGDSGSGGAKGAVPAPSAGDAAAAKFLKASGVWETPNFVTSVGLSAPSILSVSSSPVTSSGTIALSLAVQAPNLVFAGPNSGVTSLAPTFRSLVAADIPSHTHNGADITAGTVGASFLGVMTGATSGVAGASGAVPQPIAGDQVRFLRGDATWVSVGTVTSVAMTTPTSLITVSGSPVTTTGTLSVSLTNASANQVWAGPTTGAATTPTYRALVAADIPSHNHAGSDITAGTVGASFLGVMTGATASVAGAKGAVPQPIAGDDTRFLRGDGTWVASGSVTSVALALPSFITVSGSPVTSTGTLTGTLANQSANTFFAGPSVGSAAAPTFRIMAAADMIVMVGATGANPGTRGAVPAPATGDNTRFLKGNATWADAVTSVALSLPSFITVSGSPVTTTGTLTGTLATQSANLIFSGPTTGSAAAPTFRTLVAADIPLLNTFTSSTTIASTGDYIPFYSSSATDNRVITLSNLLTGTAPEGYNFLINTDFEINQRQVSTIGDDVYCFDHWYVLSQTGNVTVSQQTNAIAIADAGRYGRFLQANAAAQRYGIAQVVEFQYTRALRNFDSHLIFRARASTSMTLRVAVLRWTSASADAPISDVVNDWTSSTYTTGNFFISTTTSVAVVTSFALTTSYQLCDVTVTAGSTNNYIVFFWTESAQAQNAYFELSDTGFYITAGVPTRKWIQPDPTFEISRCLRYYEKSYRKTVAPATVTSAAAENFFIPVALSGAGKFLTNIKFQVDKVISPTITIYDSAAATTGVLRDVNKATAEAAVAANVTEKNFELQTNTGASINAGDVVRFHWVAEAEL